MKEINWQRWAAVVICVAAGVAVLLLSLRLLLGSLLPFVLAWVLSLGITPLAERLSVRLRLSKRLCAAVLFTGALCGGVLLLGFAVNRLLTELEELLARLAESGFPESVGSVDYFGALAQRLSFLRRPEFAEREATVREAVNRAVTQWINELLTALREQVPALATKMLSAIPSALLFLAVTVISGFYFCMDRRGIEEGMAALLPPWVRQRLPGLRKRLRRVSVSYLRAYLLLLLLTLLALFTGLSILRVDYAFLLATVIAVVDLLPVLGVGTVLLPWSLVCLLQRDYRLGVGLLILYLAVVLLHQVAEPRLVGKSLGLHPLLTVAVTYVGFRAFGIFGMVLGPFLAVAAKGALGWGRGAAES